MCHVSVTLLYTKFISDGTAGFFGFGFFLVFGYGQQYGYGHTGIRLVLPYHGYTGRRKKSHTVARMLDRGEKVSPPPPPAVD